MPSLPNGRGVLLVSGNGMNYIILQLWLILSVPLRLRGYRIYATTFRAHGLRNRYLRWMRVACIYLDEIRASEPADTAAAIRALRTFEEVRSFSYQGSPIGEIALSTYSRNFGTGLIDVSDPKVLDYVHTWMARSVVVMVWGKEIFARHDIEILFFTEVFTEEYGALYDAAINARLNVLRQALTVRDDSIILQHLSLENDRIHHSSIAPSTWEAIERRTDDAQMEAELRPFHVSRL